MVAWGTVMTLMGVVQDFEGLLISRLFLGITEAGLYPGVAYYITMWYCRTEAQFRQAMFFSAASVAGAFSGLLAFGIAKMDGVGGYEGWRWIFILEGILTVVVAVIAFFTIYDFPETAKFLTEPERAWVVHRLRYQGSKDSGQMVAESEHFKWKTMEYVKIFPLSPPLTPTCLPFTFPLAISQTHKLIHNQCTGASSAPSTAPPSSSPPLSANSATPPPQPNSSPSPSTSPRPSSPSP
ncbi:MAG: hypothetical protein Q9204_009385 [Flavoplaca sp. TL-2023a]